MSTNSKLTVFCLLFLSLVIFRSLFSFSKQVSQGPLSFQGEVGSVPYISIDKLKFKVGNYYVSSSYQSINLGDRVRVVGNLKDGQVTASKVQVLPQAWWEKGLNNLRQALVAQITRYFPNPQASLLVGITLGQNIISKDFKNDLIATGTIHVVVVSGYNIALVAGFILAFASLIGRRKATLLAIVVIICYTFLVGFTAPTVRAAITGLITLSAVLLGKKTLAFYALFLTCALMLLLDPTYLTNISFQLTFLATLGVLSFTKYFEVKLSKVPYLFRETLATTLAAQVLVIPILFYYFGTISLLAPLVNTLVLWVVPILTLLGFIFLPLSFLSSAVAEMLSFVTLAPLTFFTSLVHFFGGFKLFLLTLEPNNLYLLIGYYLVVTSLVWQKQKLSRRELKTVEGGFPSGV